MMFRFVQGLCGRPQDRDGIWCYRTVDEFALLVARWRRLERADEPI